MTSSDEYEPSPAQWVRDQVELYERSGGTEGNILRDTGLPVVIITTRGNKTGKLRKSPLMRVEHDGEYALVGSMGGAPTDPMWVHNIRADPEAVTVQDGAEPFVVSVREVEGDERAMWWERAVAAYPPYAEYRSGRNVGSPCSSLPLEAEPRPPATRSRPPIRPGLHAPASERQDRLGQRARLARRAQSTTRT